jgi:hypothetical protein
MDLPATDSASRCREQDSGQVFFQLDYGCCRVVSKWKISKRGRGIALPGRWPFDAHGSRTLRKRQATAGKIVSPLGLGDCYLASHKPGEGRAADCALIWREPQESKRAGTISFAVAT